MSFVNVKYGSTKCVVALLTLVARHKNDIDKGGIERESNLAGCEATALFHRMSISRIAIDGVFSFVKIANDANLIQRFHFASSFLRRGLSIAFCTLPVNNHRNWFRRSFSLSHQAPHVERIFC